jgi:histone H3/H4
MSEKKAKEKKEMTNDGDAGEQGRYAFPEAAIVRIMKRQLDKEKMIKKDVKVAMNKWLERMCAKVSREMNKVPYVMMTLNEFNEGKRVFDDIESMDKEKKRILAHLDAIKKDIERMERDLGKVEKDVLELAA